MDGVALSRPDVLLHAQTRSMDLARSTDFARATPAEAAEQMEALFATLLVKELSRTLPGEGFFGEGPGSDVFNGWMDEFLGERLATDGALDLAGRVKTALEARAGTTTSEQGGDR